MQNFFSGYKIKEVEERDLKITNGRQAALREFVERLNKEREGKSLRPLSPAFVSKKMADGGIKTEGDLVWFFAQCKEAKNFSAYWWWALRGTKSEEN